MANPIAFKPVTVDWKADLQRKLERAPAEHAEALLLAYDVLEAARKEGLLDLLHGAIGARDTIVTKIAKYASQPEGIAALRNLLNAGKILAELDPETLEHVGRALARASAQQKQEEKPPSLWQLFKRATSEDGRRGLSFMTLMLSGLGRSLKE
ncbi:MAG: DUF1641 domain-containing protein [Acidobacteriota bacterium]|nr:DUF1641 domain-containing protein [Acidobacteriota bacterium]